MKARMVGRLRREEEMSWLRGEREMESKRRESATGRETCFMMRKKRARRKGTRSSSRG